VKKAATAVGLALFLWLVLVYFGDLGLMGTAVVVGMDVEQLLALALVNPLQVFKIAAVLDLRENLEVLGPAGIYAFRTYGGALWPMLVGLLFIWVVAPFLLATQVFKKRGVI
jgi:Cu-processing system permease protein